MRNSLVGLVLCLAATPAMAHVSLAPASAPPGKRVMASFHVGHGCNGAATTALQVEMPLSLVAVEPQAPPGWSVAVVRAGNLVSIVTWKGGELPADKALGFPIAMTLPLGTGALAFPATQFCGAQKLEWTELPRGNEKLAHPAPLLQLAAVTTEPQSGLAVADGWFRSLPASLPAGGYFTLRNGGKQKAVLTGAESPGCGMVMMHRSSGNGGTSSMEHVMSVDVPAGGSIAFAPIGYHLMCMEPRPVMKPGATVPVTLLFQGGGKVTANFAVRNAAGR